jgi:hypothetical protein
MKPVVRFFAVSGLIGAALVGLDYLAVSGQIEALRDGRQWLHGLPYVGGVLFRDPMTFSRWVTVILLVLGAGYIFVHAAELAVRVVMSVFGRSHTGFGAKRRVGHFFLGAMALKTALVLIQIGLIVTQAWSLRSFLRGVFEDPTTFYELVRTDFIFMGLLVVLVVIRFIRPREAVEEV